MVLRGFWFPLACPALGLGDLGRCHLGGNRVAELSCVFISVGPGEIEKQVCRNAILGNAFALVVHPIEVELRCRVSLVGGVTVPLSGFSKIQGNPLAFVVHKGEVVLRLSITLLNGAAEPFKGFRKQLGTLLNYWNNFDWLPSKGDAWVGPIRYP